MEKRVLQAVLLSLAVLLLYQSFFAPRRQPAPAAPATPAAPNGSAPTAGSSPPVAPPPAGASVPGQASSTLPSAVTTTGGARVIVESDQFRAEFSTRGAVLLSWTLKKYPASNGEPLDLLPDMAGINARPAFSLTTSDEVVSNTLAAATFTPSATSLDLRAAGGRSIRFDYSDPSGLRATKIFTFQRDNQPFLVGFSAQVLSNGQPQNFVIHSGPGIGDIVRAQPSGGFLFGSYYQPPAGITFADEIARYTAESFAEQRVFEQKFRYAGVDDHYFLGAALLDRQTRVEYTTHPMQTVAGPRSVVSYALGFAQPPSEVKFYFGPKDD
jgi:YidC/Oxa1 family membrane protein insertase